MEHNEVLAHAKLILGLQTSELDTCWAQGYEASLFANSDELENPYEFHSKEYQYWQEGWWEATLHETPLFENMVSLAANDELIEQPKASRFDYHQLIARSIQFGSVAMIAAIGVELADLAMANLGMFEVFAFV
jgi:ribosome modulation factor